MGRTIWHLKAPHNGSEADVCSTHLCILTQHWEVESAQLIRYRQGF